MFSAGVGVRYKRAAIIVPTPDLDDGLPFDPCDPAWKWLGHKTRVEHCDPHRGRLMEHVRR